MYAGRRSGFKSYFIWFTQEPVPIHASSQIAAIGWYFRRECDNRNLTEEKREKLANDCIQLYHDGFLPVTYRDRAARLMVNRPKREIAETVAAELSFGQGKPEKYEQYVADMMKRPLAHLMKHCAVILWKDRNAMDKRAAMARK